MKTKIDLSTYQIPDSRALVARVVSRAARIRGEIQTTGKVSTGQKKRLLRLRALAVTLAK